MDMDWMAEATHRAAAMMADAEIHLIRLLAQQVKAGIRLDPYDIRQVQRLIDTRDRMTDELNLRWERIDTEARRVLAEASTRGMIAADHEIPTGGLGGTMLPDAIRVGVEAIALDTVATIAQIRPIILRTVVDEYQRLVAPSVGQVVSGTLTTVEATQVALNRFARQGITGFIDRSGREWRPDAYLEMAVRSGSARAMRYGWQQTAISRGVDLAKVTGNTYTCPACAPWQGQVISLTGMTPNGRQQVPSTLDPNVLVWVDVKGSLAEAEAAGLHHPNCTHTETAYFPGATTTTLPDQRQEDPETYEASQQQRAAERAIREALRVQAAAITEGAAREAEQRILKMQDRIESLMSEHPKLTRQWDREQIATAH